MKVTLKPAAGSVLKITTKDGTVLTNDDVKAIEVTPFFSLANGPGEVVRGEALTEGGESLDTFTLTASGSNGKVKRTDVIERVVPLVDKKKAEPKAVPKATPPAAATTPGVSSQPVGRREGNDRR